MTDEVERRWCEVIRKRKRRRAEITERMENIYAYSIYGTAAGCGCASKG